MPFESRRKVDISVAKRRDPIDPSQAPEIVVKTVSRGSAFVQEILLGSVLPGAQAAMEAGRRTVGPETVSVLREERQRQRLIEAAAAAAADGAQKGTGTDEEGAAPVTAAHTAQTSGTTAQRSEAVKRRRNVCVVRSVR